MKLWKYFLFPDLKVSLLQVVMLAALVVAAAALGGCVAGPGAAATDPLLLEYSDYYYDLYYGDYEDYSPDTGAQLMWCVT